MITISSSRWTGRCRLTNLIVIWGLRPPGHQCRTPPLLDLEWEDLGRNEVGEELASYADQGLCVE